MCNPRLVSLFSYMFEINTLLGYWLLSIVIVYYGLLSTVINLCQSIKIDNFFVSSIVIDYRYQSITIGDWYRLISSVTIDFQYRFLSIDFAWNEKSYYWFCFYGTKCRSLFADYIYSAEGNTVGGALKFREIYWHLEEFIVKFRCEYTTVRV